MIDTRFLITFITASAHTLNALSKACKIFLKEKVKKKKKQLHFLKVLLTHDRQFSLVLNILLHIIYGLWYAP